MNEDTGGGENIRRPSIKTRKRRGRGKSNISWEAE
jgi:hypothetical protein